MYLYISNVLRKVKQFVYEFCVQIVSYVKLGVFYIIIFDMWRKKSSLVLWRLETCCFCEGLPLAGGQESGSVNNRSNFI
jgi:hypothetical protein